MASFYGWDSTVSVCGVSNIIQAICSLSAYIRFLVSAQTTEFTDNIIFIWSKHFLGEDFFIKELCKLVCLNQLCVEFSVQFQVIAFCTFLCEHSPGSGYGLYVVDLHHVLNFLQQNFKSFRYFMHILFSTMPLSPSWISDLNCIYIQKLKIYLLNENI